MGNINEFFVRADTNGDGMIDWDELQNAMENKKIQKVLTKLKIEPEELEELFVLLDKNGDGDLDRDEFVQGVSQLKAGSLSVDLAKLNVRLSALYGRALFFGNKIQRLGHVSKVMVLACEQMRADCDLLMRPLNDPRLLSKVARGEIAASDETKAKLMLAANDVEAKTPRSGKGSARSNVSRRRRSPKNSPKNSARK